MKLINYPIEQVLRFCKTSSLLGFAKALGNPCYFALNGCRSGAPIVITTLLHGNEPSGLSAIQNLLKQAVKPEFDTVFVIASISAALTPPPFTHRMLENQLDLNRCFSGSRGNKKHTLQHDLADSISHLVKQLKPQCLIDIHNTSGSSPAFAVAIRHNNEIESLAAHFCSRLIVTDIKLGSIMEQDFGCPVLTIEAGGSQDNEANLTAFDGLSQLLQDPAPLTRKAPLEVLKHPRRLELQENVSITYSNQYKQAFDLVIHADIEKLNFGETPANYNIAWCNAPFERLLTTDSAEHDLRHYFYQDEDRILTKKPMRFFMVTTRADIAASDCLLYFVD